MMMSSSSLLSASPGARNVRKSEDLSEAESATSGGSRGIADSGGTRRRLHLNETGNEGGVASGGGLSREQSSALVGALSFQQLVPSTYETCLLVDSQVCKMS